MTTRFIFSPDKHVGWQQTPNGLQPLHDQKAINAMLNFASDFLPDTWIEGGDNMDYGPVSHWLTHKKKSSEGLDLSKDAREYTRKVLEPINEIMARRSKTAKKKIWMEGNHEGWGREFAESNPGVANLVDPRHLLDLKGWEFKAEGEHVQLGKLYVVHGDKIGNGKNAAGRAVQLYGHPVLFGHFHTFQVAPHHELIGVDSVKMGMCVPGLCNKNPNYMGNKPNQWMKGFAYGYVHEDGSFQVFVPIIVNSKFCANGKVYKG